MTRPALSASRALDIVDLLMAYPTRSFTMSEIARAIKVNTASCHAILGILVEREYLTRSEGQKAYALGPVLLAAGGATLESQPLLASAREGAARLFDELGVPALLTGRIGNEILGLASFSAPGGRQPGLHVGQRVPLRPPLGAPFLAWASPGDIDDWFEQLETVGAALELRRQLHQSLALIRERGFQVTLATPTQNELSALIGSMASSGDPWGSRTQLSSLLASLDGRLAQPETIEAGDSYDVNLISAPIFDNGGRARFSLCLGGFDAPLTGARLNHYADRLMRICVEAMQRGRQQASG